MDTDREIEGYHRMRNATRRMRLRMESILESAVLLEPKDAAILRLRLVANTTFRDIATLTGLGERAVSRRIRRLIGRLETWRCIRLRGERLDAGAMMLARSCVTRGFSIGQVAAAHGVSRHDVARALKSIEAATGVAFIPKGKGKRRRGETNEVRRKR